MTAPQPSPLSALLGVARAGKAVDRALAAVRRTAALGVRAGDLDTAVQSELARLGARPTLLGYQDALPGGPFPAAVSITVNDEIMGGSDPDRLLESGDLITADLAAEYQGWHADAADSWTLGPAPADRALLAGAARAACVAGVTALRPGVPWSSVASAMQRAADRAGAILLRGYDAHGIGRAMHQPPRMPCHPDDAARLNPPVWTPRPGDIVTIEPVVATLDSGVVREGWLERTRTGGPACFVEATIAVGIRRNLVLAGRCWWPAENDLRAVGA